MICKFVESPILVCGKEVKRVREKFFLVLDFPKELARIEIDTSSFKKLVVSLDFTTYIQVIDGVNGDTDKEGIVLNFRVKRLCNGREEVMKEYQEARGFFFASISDSYDTRDSFSFMLCDEVFNCKNKCCKYSVEFSGFEMIGGGGQLDELVIEDSSISAIVQELC